jgi:hypothetical protein
MKWPIEIHLSTGEVFGSFIGIDEERQTFIDRGGWVALNPEAITIMKGTVDALCQIGYQHQKPLGHRAGITHIKISPHCIVKVVWADRLEPSGNGAVQPENT